ncbi:MAG TPA: DUF6125 family protein [Candidatus Deferrimicrobium sp.]|nr:DUF6125 family protein [Candidatus Deferrimicrobium sp.]
MDQLKDLSREQLEELLQDFAKRWLAHDGLWFQAIEQGRDMDEAIRYDIAAWEKFTVIEAKRIMGFLGLKPGGGLQALEQALKFRLYAFINVQSTEWINEKTLVFKMNDCRVQSARNRKGMADFPCKPVGLQEYSLFAKAIDPRISTRCIACPPDEHPQEFYCGWEFTLVE